MVSESLKQQVRRKLNITWSDEITDARVDDIINSAIPDLIHLLGIADTEFDFSQAGKENTLFLSYCLYDWNHCLHEFQENYANDIAQVRDKHAVKVFKQSEETEGE